MSYEQSKYLFQCLCVIYRFPYSRRAARPVFASPYLDDAIVGSFATIEKIGGHRMIFKRSSVSKGQAHGRRIQGVYRADQAVDAIKAEDYR